MLGLSLLLTGLSHPNLKDYVALWRTEKSTYMRKLNDKRRKKVSFLVRKYSHVDEVPNEVRGIVVDNQRVPDEFSSEPRSYGGVDLTTDRKIALSLPPKYSIHAPIDTTDCEAQVEKGICKLRWSIKSKEAEERGEVDDRQPFRGANSFNFKNMRATDLPFNKRICLPEPVDDATEIVLYDLKLRLKEATRTVKSRSETPESVNLTKQEQSGISSLKKKVADKEIVIFQTDKSGRVSVDTPENYRIAMQSHFVSDPVISQERTNSIEKVLNAHSIVWTRILSAGTLTRNEKRIKDSMISSNSAIPPLYGLRKDHKVHQDTRAGPPTRPVCGANSSVNYKLSHLLSMLLAEVWQRDTSGSVCMNTEEMMAEIARVNNEVVPEDIVIGSTDVKAL